MILAWAIPFDKDDILCKYHFGFRQHYSTNLASIILVVKITESLHKGGCILGVFLDLSQAFDTVNHNFILTNYIYIEFVVQH